MALIQRGNLYIREPKKGFSAAAKKAVEDFINEVGASNIKTGKNCPIVVFTRKGGKPVATQRCRGQDLAAANRYRCKSEKTGRFVRPGPSGCPAGSKRARPVYCVDPSTGSTTRPKKGKCPCIIRAGRRCTERAKRITTAK